MAAFLKSRHSPKLTNILPKEDNVNQSYLHEAAEHPHDEGQTHGADLLNDPLG